MSADSLSQFFAAAASNRITELDGKVQAAIKKAGLENYFRELEQLCGRKLAVRLVIVDEKPTTPVTAPPASQNGTVPVGTFPAETYTALAKLLPAAIKSAGARGKKFTGRDVDAILKTDGVYGYRYEWISAYLVW